jgi:hypothetical protein
MPFKHALESLADMLRVHVSEATARRETEHWGAAYVEVQKEEVERIEQELPPAPAGPEKMLLSVDGAMVPLVGGEWVEVKTLALGVIEEPVWEKDEWKVHASELSYFSRWMEAEKFGRAALGETHHRGLETAAQVVAVTDGAVWEQGFIDYHREDAARVLDFPHAAEYVAESGQAVWGEGTEETNKWLNEQLHTLKHEGPTDVLSVLQSLTQDHPEHPKLSKAFAYLEKREAQMQYPLYLKQGWPIGSGAVESANKLVVEARLKGAGMHWAPAHVNPMLALRNALCSGRWAQASAQILAHQQLQRKRMRHSRRVQRLSEQATAHESTEALSCAQPLECTTKTSAPQPNSLVETPAPSLPESSSPRKPWRPGPDHPWRHSPIGKARYRKRSYPHPAKK